MKQALVTAPDLVMPDYNKQFIIQTDASGVGIVLLCQLHDVNGTIISRPHLDEVVHVMVEQYWNIY